MKKHRDLSLKGSSSVTYINLGYQKAGYGQQFRGINVKPVPLPDVLKQNNQDKFGENNDEKNT